MVEHYLLSMTRESVAAGDDIFAPHETTLRVSSQATALHVCREIKTQPYLAAISGGLATWVVKLDDDPIGVIAQQWEKPKVFRESIPLKTNSVIHCEYHVQEDPDKVFSKYQNLTADNPK